MIRELDPRRDLPDIFKGSEKDNPVFIKIDLDHTRRRYGDLILSGIMKAWVLCDDRTGKILGGFGFTIAEDLHRPVLVALENFWWIAPEARNGLGGMELFRKFERYAKTAGCKKIGMLQMMNAQAEKFEKFYLANGYLLEEKTFVKEL